MKAPADEGEDLLYKIKRLTVMAMFSDDELFDYLVLKGGNALDLIHAVSTRASVDLDFSMQDDFPGGADNLCRRVERALKRTYQSNGYEVFDVRIEERPAQLSEDMKGFWGGYAVEFKLIDTASYQQFANNIEDVRRRAIRIGRGQKFLIDISKFEYVLGKEEADLDGYKIYVYSRLMIVCEKLRAICQQMPEYGVVINRERPGAPRARDFLDIYVLVHGSKVDMASNESALVLREMFSVKKVPLRLLGLIQQYREFHKTDFPSVKATVRPGNALQDFDFYFDYVVDLIETLKPFWDK